MRPAATWRQLTAAPATAVSLVALVVHHALRPQADRNTAAPCLRRPSLSALTSRCVVQPAELSAIVARITSFLLAAAPVVLPSAAARHDSLALTMQRASWLHPVIGAPSAPSGQSGVVAFYAASDVPYGPLSNYSLCSIRIDGLLYPSVEHYYQSSKFAAPHTEYRELIRLASTAHQAKLLARQTASSGYHWRTALNPLIEKHLRLSVRVREDWEEQKDAVMFRALQAKFEQHPQLARLLLGTGDKAIVEQSPRDAYWGCGKDGTGRNKLGYLLMNVRSWLLKKQRLQQRKRQREGRESM